MKEFDKYHPYDRVTWSLATLFGFGGFATFFNNFSFSKILAAYTRFQRNHV